MLQCFMFILEELIFKQLELINYFNLIKLINFFQNLLVETDGRKFFQKSI